MRGAARREQVAPGSVAADPALVDTLPPNVLLTPLGWVRRSTRCADERGAGYTTVHFGNTN